MLCSECYKEIPERKEIQIRGLIFCKKCIESNESIKKEVAAKCYSCSKLIYNDEQIYEVFLSWGISWYISANKSERLVQCHSCYKKWLVKVKEEKKWWKKRKWLLATCATASLISLSLHFFLKPNSTADIIVIIIFLISSFIFILILYSAPETDGRFVSSEKK